MSNKEDDIANLDASPPPTYPPTYQVVGKELLKALLVGVLFTGGVLWVSGQLISRAGGAAFFPPSYLGSMAAFGVTANELAWLSFGGVSILFGIMAAIETYEPPTLPPQQRRSAGWRYIAKQRHALDVIAAGVIGFFVGLVVWLLVALLLLYAAIGVGVTGTPALVALVIALVAAFYAGRWAYRRVRRYEAVIFVGR